MGALCRPLLLLCHVAYFSWFYAEPMENQLRMAIREANVQDVNVLARVHADVWASVFDGIATGMSDDDASSPIGSISPATADFVAGTYDRSLRHFTDVFAGKIPATVWLAIVDGQLAFPVEYDQVMTVPFVIAKKKVFTVLGFNVFPVFFVQAPSDEEEQEEEHHNTSTLER